MTRSGVGLMSLSVAVVACGPVAAPIEDGQELSDSDGAGESPEPEPEPEPDPDPDPEPEPEPEPDPEPDPDPDPEPDPDPPDPPEPGPCDAVELGLIWEAVDPSQERAEALALGDDAVYWSAAGFTSTTVRSMTLDGDEQWAHSSEAVALESTLVRQAFLVEDTITFVGTRFGSGSTFVIEELDLDGTLLFESGSIPDMVSSIHRSSNGILVTGERNDDLLFMRFLDDWSVDLQTTYEHGAGEWAIGSVPSDDGGWIAFGHTNAIGAPILGRFDADGAPIWVNEIDAGDGLAIGNGLTGDGQGGVFIAMDAPGGTGLVMHYDGDGAHLGEFAVDYLLQDVALDSTGRLLLAGRAGNAGAYVERRATNGFLVQQLNYPAAWIFDVEPDGECNVYISGTTSNFQAFVAELG